MRNMRRQTEPCSKARSPVALQGTSFGAAVNSQRTWSRRTELTVPSSEMSLINQTGYSQMIATAYIGGFTPGVGLGGCSTSGFGLRAALMEAWISALTSAYGLSTGLFVLSRHPLTISPTIGNAPY
jgi:hypothetical protein